MHTFIVQLSCGCCDAEVQFLSEERIAAAFTAAGLSSTATITDDAGEEIGSVDTFYGWRRADEDRRGLSWLAAQVLGGSASQGN